jgi:hypothetical protein
MYMVCRHIKTNGHQCHSPALRGAQFCYYHSRLHGPYAGTDPQHAPLQLPMPEDAAAIQLSVSRINDAIINGGLDLKKAASLFTGLKIAANFIDAKAFFYAEGTVQSAEQTPEGDQLAPRNYKCKEDDSCNECPYATEDQCQDWHYIGKNDSASKEEENDDADDDDGDDEDDDDEDDEDE